MKRSSRQSKQLTDRDACEELLDVSLRDRREYARVRTALARWVAEEGPIRNGLKNLDALDIIDTMLGERIDHARRGAAEAGDGNYFHVNTPQELASERRVIRRLQRAVPLRFFAGLPIESSEEDLRRVAKVEGKAVPDSPDAESAFLLLPTAWLRAIHGLHDLGRRPRTRVLLAADCAAPLYAPALFRQIVEREFDTAPLRFLARVVAAGHVPEDAISPEERTGLRMDFDWRLPAGGAGGRLRQQGFLFVGMRDGRRTLYVPESARPVMALILGSVLLERGVPKAARTAKTLRALSVIAVRGTMREVAFSAPGLVATDALPTRRARIRRRTPGPDRVVELEIVLRRGEGRVLRRIRISYQRALGALHEALQLAFGLPDTETHAFHAVGENGERRAWFSSTREDPVSPDVDEWQISIHAALADSGGKLTYAYCSPSGITLDIRRVSLHTPESVAAEPRVVWADGVLAPVEGADTSPSQASLDAANVFLERLDP